MCVYIVYKHKIPYTEQELSRQKKNTYEIVKPIGRRRFIHEM